MSDIGGGRYPRRNGDLSYPDFSKMIQNRVDPFVLKKLREDSNPQTFTHVEFDGVVDGCFLFMQVVWTSGKVDTAIDDNGLPRYLGGQVRSQVQNRAGNVRRYACLAGGGPFNRGLDTSLG